MNNIWNFLQISFTPEEFSQIKAFFQAEKTTVSVNYTSNSIPFCSSSTTQNSESFWWIIYSGATNHITTSVIDKAILSMFSQVTLPNVSYEKITSGGSAYITKSLHIHGVLCAPLFHVNLLLSVNSHLLLIVPFTFFPLFVYCRT